MVGRAVGWMIAVGFANNRRPTNAGPEVVVVRLSAGSGSLVIDCGTHMADIVFVNPRFEVSYWGLEHALPLIAQAGESADGMFAAAGRPDAGGAQRHDRR